MNLRTYLSQEGLTQHGFAETIGVSQGLIWQWLNGRTRITLDRALQIEELTQGSVSVRDWPMNEEASA